jgi:hypothetical protein
MIDPLERWAEFGEKPDYAGLLTFAGLPYTQDPAELAGVDAAVVGAPFDDLVSHPVSYKNMTQPTKRIL